MLILILFVDYLISHFTSSQLDDVRQRIHASLNIVVIVRCTIYDSVFMDCSLLIYPLFQSKVFFIGSFHSFLVFPSKFESLHANPKMRLSDIL